MRHLITLFCCLCSITASAAPGEIDFTDRIFNKTFMNYKFLPPNETHLGLAKPIFESAPAGAYVTVGTERGWMAAGLAENVTHIVFRDNSHDVGVYNTINAFLLKAARKGDREHYLQLRFHPTKATWRVAAMEAGFSERETKYFLELCERWDLIVNRRVFRKFHSPDGPFRGLNYLFDDKLFARVQMFAKENRVSIDVMDFNNQAAVDQLVDKLKANGIPLSVLDYSNAWWYNMWQGYTEPKAMVHFLARFSEIASDKAQLLLTSTNIWATCLAYATDGACSNHFNYGAYTFKNIRSYGNMESFRKSLWTDWLSLSFTTKQNSFPPTAARCAHYLLSGTRELFH